MYASIIDIKQLYGSHMSILALILLVWQYNFHHKLNLKIMCKEKYKVKEKSPANQAVTAQQMADEYMRYKENLRRNLRSISGTDIFLIIIDQILSIYSNVFLWKVLTTILS